ncbi:CoA ester lyase [Streptomyces sp. NPDC001941]|uniref:HpcH/HpaI aldolase/citrate lyase family protein n=1 Tax=Streptomyces sp. NPDC001941 TaxID=3154659 RepID=UPI00331D3587
MQASFTGCDAVLPEPSPGIGGPAWLVTPGISPGRFATAVGCGAHVVLLDLEDAVPPGSKAAARAAVFAFVSARARGAGGPVLGVRINAVDSADGQQDIAAMAEWNVWPDLVVVPKAESGGAVDAVIRAACAARAVTRVWALIESPRALVALEEIVNMPGLAGVLFGAADYAAAAGCRLTSRALWYPRSQLVTAAAAAGIAAVDSPFFALNDRGGLRQDAVEAAELGFCGKVAVHPQQVSVIAEAFAPTAQELRAARAVLQAADAAHGSITTTGGAMVGPPVVAAARALIRRATPATDNRGTSPVPAPKGN